MSVHEKSVMQNIVYIVVFYFISVFSSTEAFQNTNDRTEYSGKFCQYRNVPYAFPYEFFNEVTGHGCYDFSNPSMIQNRIQYVNVPKYYSPFNFTYSIRGGIYEKDGIKTSFTFDYKNETVKQYVAESFVSDKYFQKWLLCCQMAEECCEKTMTNENIRPNKEKNTCPVVWDGWDCFNATPANTEAKNVCPDYISMGDPPCRLTSTKECFSNGTWNPITDYTTCNYGSIVIDN